MVVEPVKVRISGDYDPKELAEVAQMATIAIKRELGKDWKIVDRPAGRTLRVRAALTAVTVSNPAANVVLTVVFVPLVNGGLSAEASIEDASSGKRIGALAWADEGRFNPTGYFSAYGHAKALTDDFAKTVAMVIRRVDP